MGLYGTTILYAVGGRAPGVKRLEPIGRDVLRAFERVGLLVTGATEVAEVDRDPTWATHLTRADSDSLLTLAHFGVDARQLCLTLDELIFTQTQAEWAEGVDMPDFNSPEVLALPLLDVTVLSKRIPARNGPDNSIACRSWLMIEFSFEDIRFHEEVNFIRQEDHPLFAELAAVLNTEIGWTVVVH